MTEIRNWKELTDLTNGARLVVERVRILDSGIAIEGQFEPTALARLTSEDQVFVMTFVLAHGSIKEMESIFGISYPTVKNRLNRISESLQPVGNANRSHSPSGSQETKARSTEILDSLEAGEIDVVEAVKRLSE